MTADHERLADLDARALPHGSSVSASATVMLTLFAQHVLGRSAALMSRHVELLGKGL